MPGDARSPTGTTMTPCSGPAWEDTADETDVDRLGIARAPRPAAKDRQRSGRLAVRRRAAPRCSARCAPPPTRSPGSTPAPPPHPTRCARGCIARMAVAEAAGWLAHAHAWVHPLDLALRDARAHRPTALAAVGAGHRALPQTFAGPADAARLGRSAVRGDGRGRPRRRRGAGTRPAAAPPGRQHRRTMFASATAAAETLAALGAGGLDAESFSAWWSQHAPKPGVRRRRYGSREGRGAIRPCRRCCWRRRRRTAGWRPASPSPRRPPTRCSPRPAWSPAPASPAPCSSRSGRPIPPPASAIATTCRACAAMPPIAWSAATGRSPGRSRFSTWSPRAPAPRLRELDRLEAVAEQGRGLAAERDKRSRLPDAIEALLRIPVLTPKALAGTLGIAPQTATALLRALQAKGVVREVTGRGSFRAFAV